MKFLSMALAMFLSAAISAVPALAAERWEDLPMPPAMPQADNSGLAAVNGIEMYYAVYGAGDPILLIHGGLGHADIWSNQVAELSKDHRVIVADSRGHGRSSRTADPYSYTLMAADYLALLDHLKIDKAGLVGWSDGGIIGLEIAIHHPERLSWLFAQAANATVDGVDPGVMENKTFLAYIERSGVDYMKMSRTPDQYDAFVEQISGMWATQPTYTKEQLGGIATRTAIVLGDHDEAITRAHTDYLAASIPGAELVILQDTSHFAMLQDPAGYTRAVVDFMNGK